MSLIDFLSAFAGGLGSSLIILVIAYPVYLIQKRTKDKSNLEALCLYTEHAIESVKKLHEREKIQEEKQKITETMFRALRLNEINQSIKQALLSKNKNLAGSIISSVPEFSKHLYLKDKINDFDYSEEKQKELLEILFSITQHEAINLFQPPFISIEKLEFTLLNESRDFLNSKDPSIFKTIVQIKLLLDEISAFVEEEKKTAKPVLEYGGIGNRGNGHVVHMCKIKIEILERLDKIYKLFSSFQEKTNNLKRAIGLKVEGETLKKDCWCFKLLYKLS